MIYIGTSGWAYPHWKNGVFYPENLKGHELLHYQRYFDTVELNSSFYHLPKKETFEKWRQLVSENFIFSVKGPRYISHILRLSEPREPLATLLQNTQGLGKKLGPIFFQFPPSFRSDPKRLAQFAELLPPNQRFAFEFRHGSWFSTETYEVLRKNNLALIIADTPSYPHVEVITANFVYLRLHGHERLYQSNYNRKQLKEYAKKIQRWAGKGFDVYCYFDNDFHGFAPQNALELKELLALYPQKRFSKS